MAESNHINIETELSRDLGLISALAIGVGTMIAAGIFSLSGLAIQNVGSAAIISFILAAIVALFTALTYCEFVSIYPDSGEGYLYARKTFSPPLAFLVGWALFLGYASSCGFYLATLSSYFVEFVYHLEYGTIVGIVSLILLTLLNVKGTKESGTFQIVVTAVKVILLVWLVIGGIGSVDPQVIVDKFSTDFGNIASTAALVFVTFFGFSAIAASAGEIINPIKTIPRAIFISMGLVTTLYTLVILVIIAANLTEYDEAAMGQAAKLFLGGVGGMVIVGGGLFSMVSATNASIMAGSRVSLAMSQLGHLPTIFSRINQRTKTPIVSLALIGGTILAFLLVLSLKGTANFANAVLLIALILVNVALIVHRRKFPNIKRPFRVPLVPILPILGILSNLYLLIQSTWELWVFGGFFGGLVDGMEQTGIFPVVLAVGMLGIGFTGFILLKGFDTEEIAEIVAEVPTKVTFDPISIHASQLPEQIKFRILVTLSNPANVPQLLEIANSIAKERDAEIVGMRVAIVPEQLSPNPIDFEEAFYVKKERPILELAKKYADENNIPIKLQIEVGKDPADVIMDSAQRLDCDLIIMGWKGFTTTSERILGEVADKVVSNAKTDLMLVKVVAGSSLKNWLMPTTGGKHAIQAERYSAAITHANQGAMTFCSIVPPHAGESITEGTQRILNKAAERVAEETDLEINRMIIRNKSVSKGILEESKNHDAIMLGATENRFKKILFGSVPEVIAKESLKTVVLVKQGEKQNA